MHLRNRETQKVLSGLKRSGFLCLVRKPHFVEGVDMDELERKVDALIEDMKRRECE